MRFQIELDFCELFPEKGLLLLQNWQAFIEKVVNLKKRDITEKKDPIAFQLMNYLELENLSEGWYQV